MECRSPHSMPSGNSADILPLFGAVQVAVVILVFQLHHDDRPARAHLVTLYDRQNFLVPVFGGLQAFRVIAAQRKAFSDDPVWKPTSIPLSAHVGTGPGNHPKSHLVG